MKRTLIVALLALSTTAGTAHADGFEEGEARVSYGPDIEGLSPEGVSYALEAYFEQDLNYFRCTTGMPPICWKVSTLTLYTHWDLGYRHHWFRAKSAITFGTTITWAEWYSKTHTVACRMEAGTACGPVVPAATTKWWSDDVTYSPDQFPSPGFWRERYSGCVKQSCAAYVVRRSPTIQCFARKEQCYFVHN